MTTTTDYLDDVHAIRAAVERALLLDAPLTLDLNGARGTVRGDELRAEWAEFDMGNWFTIHPGIPALLGHARDAAHWREIEALIQRHTRGGANPDESAALLAELLDAHHGDNLAHALNYNGYATPARADRYAHTN